MRLQEKSERTETDSPLRRHLTLSALLAETRGPPVCGYIANVYQNPEVQALLRQLEIDIPYPPGQQYVMRIHPGHMASANQGYQLGPAMWWYAMRWESGKLVPNLDITSFNARNLDSHMWRRPINERRGLVLATEIGETQGPAHYLMRALKPLAIGTVYQDYQTEQGPVRSFALITRPAHQRFAKYHEKAMPLFLPLDIDVLRAWLAQEVPADDPKIATILAHPRIHSDLEVTPVKTFKDAEPTGETESLEADH